MKPRRSPREAWEGHRNERVREIVFVGASSMSFGPSMLPNGKKYYGCLFARLTRRSPPGSLRHSALAVSRRASRLGLAHDFIALKAAGVRMAAAPAVGASGQMPEPYPAAGDSLWIKRVAVRTPFHRAPCIADSSVTRRTGATVGRSTTRSASM